MPKGKNHGVEEIQVWDENRFVENFKQSANFRIQQENPAEAGAVYSNFNPDYEGSLESVAKDLFNDLKVRGGGKKVNVTLAEIETCGKEAGAFIHETQTKIGVEAMGGERRGGAPLKLGLIQRNKKDFYHQDSLFYKELVGNLENTVAQELPKLANKVGGEKPTAFEKLRETVRTRAYNIKKERRIGNRALKAVRAVRQLAQKAGSKARKVITRPFTRSKALPLNLKSYFLTHPLVDFIVK